MPPAGLARIPAFLQQATCQFGSCPPWLRYCMARKAGAEVNDVNDVPSLAEPHGPDGTMAVGGCKRPEISQSGTAGHLGSAVRKDRRRPRTDLAIGPDLYPSGLRH